jgi:hypothetical protein
MSDSRDLRLRLMEGRRNEGRGEQRRQAGRGTIEEES